MRRCRFVLMGRCGYVPLRRLGDVPLRRCWVLDLRLVWHVVETYWWDVAVTSSWDVITTLSVSFKTYLRRHWDIQRDILMMSSCCRVDLHITMFVYMFWYIFITLFFEVLPKLTKRLHFWVAWCKFCWFIPEIWCKQRLVSTAQCQ